MNPLRIPWLVALLSVAGLAYGAGTPKPNIVFILIDNLGQEWFDCYGSEEHCTPQMDRLAAAGVRFANCYTSTVCGPSRVELLTGRYPFRTGWYLHHDAALYSGGGFDPKREVTIARVLRDAGYATGMTGKWQINNLYDEPDALRQHGFQESLVTPMSIDRDKVDDAFWHQFRQAIRDNNATFLQESTRKQESRYWDPVVIKDGKRDTLKGRFGPDVFQEFAIDFVRRHRDGPFFLYYPMVLTHGSSAAHALTPTPANRDHPPTDPHQAFADMVRYTDRLVADFIAALEKHGVRDNTLVLVASDNGSDESVTGRRNGRVVKGGLYHITENGSNVAFFVNSPKLVPGGRVGSLTDFTDVFPTCAISRAWRCRKASRSTVTRARITSRAKARCRGHGSSTNIAPIASSATSGTSFGTTGNSTTWKRIRRKRGHWRPGQIPRRIGHGTNCRRC
jgi:arylsulfatase A-like enzyme